MNDTRHVDWVALSQAGEDISAYAQNAILVQLNKIKALRNQVTWEGTAAQEALGQYDKFIEQMKRLAEGISKYGKFLSASAEVYKESDSKVAGAFSRSWNG